AGQAASHDLHRRAEPEAADLLPDQVLVEVALEGRVLDVHELAAVEHEPFDVRAVLPGGDVAAVGAGAAVGDGEGTGAATGAVTGTGAGAGAATGSGRLGASSVSVWHPT